MTVITSDMAKMVRMLCAIALLCVGFAHKTPSIETSITLSEIAQYTLPDSSAPVLCLSGHEQDEKHHGADPAKMCEACRITASVVLPEPADSVGQRIAVSVEIQLPIRTTTVYRQLLPPNATPRGPPASLFA